MAKVYKQVSKYGKEIIELREQGYTNREIAEHLGMTREQIRGFIKRRNRKNEKIASGQIGNKRRVHKSENELPVSVQRLSELSQMRYVMASQEKYIKQLEMENELMRDFLSLTERM